jgi:hypothetical protein
VALVTERSLEDRVADMVDRDPPAVLSALLELTQAVERLDRRLEALEQLVPEPTPDEGYIAIPKGPQRA